MGNGVKQSKTVSNLKELIKKTKIPTIFSRFGHDLISHDNNHIMGQAGIKGSRFCKKIMNQSDLVLSLGCRLAPQFVGHDFNAFNNAKVISIDVEKDELIKKGQKIDLKLNYDLKEFFHIGNPVISNPKNVWPIEVVDFEKIGTEAYLTLESIGLTILESIAIYLGLEKKYFTDKVKGGESIMRSIHYYPLNENDVQDGAVRAAAHGDINLITLLMGASADGLEIFTKDKKWIPIISEPDQLVINVGDMMERLTNKRLMSTVHRVVNPDISKLNTSRYSIPFFMHPKPHMDLSCLEGCVDKDNPKSFDDTTAGEFLEERLKEIGLKK